MQPTYQLTKFSKFPHVLLNDNGSRAIDFSLVSNFHFLTVLKAFKFNRQKDGYIKKSQLEAIAKELGISRNTLTKRLKLLVTAGIISKKSTGYQIKALHKILNNLNFNPYYNKKKKCSYFSYEKIPGKTVVKSTSETLYYLLIKNQTNERFIHNQKASLASTKNKYSLAFIKAKKQASDNDQYETTKTFEISLRKEIVRSPLYKNLPPKTALTRVYRTSEKAEKIGLVQINKRKKLIVKNVDLDIYCQSEYHNDKRFIYDSKKRNIYRVYANRYTWNADYSLFPIEPIKKELKKDNSKNKVLVLSPLEEKFSKFCTDHLVDLYRAGIVNTQRKISRRQFSSILTKIMGNTRFVHLKGLLEDLKFLLSGYMDLDTEVRKEFKEITVPYFEKGGFIKSHKTVYVLGKPLKIVYTGYETVKKISNIEDVNNCAGTDTGAVGVGTETKKVYTEEEINELLKDHPF